MDHNYGSDDDDLLVVTGGVQRRPTSSGSVEGRSPTAGGVLEAGGSSPPTDADFALALQQQRAEMRVASQHANNLHFEATAQNKALRSVVPVPEGLPTSPSSAIAGAPAAARRASGAAAAARKGVAGGRSQLDPAAAAARITALEEEVKALNGQLLGQSRAVVKMTAESEKQSKLIAALNNRIDKEGATNRDLQGRLKISEAQVAAHKKELQLMQREAAGITGVTSDTRLQKALEEIAQLKSKVATLSAGAGAPSGALGGSAAAVAQQQREQLARDNKILEAQRAELLNCVRKQNKLIEVLRRQKLHLEAAKLLQMTEDEFTRVLETS